MSAKKNDAFSEVIVGLFMIAVLSLLAYFTIVISGVDLVRGRKNVVVRVDFSDVSGLKPHDNVMYRGTKVGTVDRIEISPTNLAVYAEIDRAVVLRERYRAAVCSLSMLGGNYLLLEEGEGEAVPLETTVFRGEPPFDWIRNLSAIATDLRSLISDGGLRGIVTNCEAASANVRDLTDRLARGEGTLGRLMSSNDTVYADIQRVSRHLGALSDRVARGEGTLGKLFSADDAVYVSLKRTLDNAADLSARLSAGEGLAGRLLAKDDPIAKETEAAIAAFRAACESIDARAALAGAERLIANLDAVALKLKDGEGTLGRVINDAALYEEVTGLAKDIRQVVDNFRDTTPITTFGSLIMGGL
jgi:phospholipid/cholesterol/gamma-HCH transport system substrate-binding protein